jgi:hypothetical protein
MFRRAEMMMGTPVMRPSNRATTTAWKSQA